MTDVLWGAAYHFRMPADCVAPNWQHAHNHRWDVLRFRQHQTGGADWIKNFSMLHSRGFRSVNRFPKWETSRQGAVMQNLLEKIIFWKIKCFIPIWIELTTWYITSLQEHSSGVTFPLTLTIIGRWRKPVVRAGFKFSKRESGSCVACAFQGIDHLDLEALWPFLRQSLQKLSSKILRWCVLPNSHVRCF